MDIWKYMPRSVSLKVIKTIKDLAGTNRIRRRLLDANKELVAQDRESVELGDALVEEMNRNEVLSEELRVDKRRMEGLVKASERLKAAYEEHVAAVLVGRGTCLDEETKAELNVSAGLELLMKSTLFDNAALVEKNEDLERENFKYRVGIAVAEAEVGKYLAFAYVDGHVCGTQKFRKYCGDVEDVERVLEGNIELANALSEGKSFRGEYDGMKFVFLGRKENSDVDVAYIVPTERKSRRKVFVKAGVSAARKLRDSLRETPDFGGLNFA